MTTPEGTTTGRTRAPTGAEVQQVRAWRARAGVMRGDERRRQRVQHGRAALLAVDLRPWSGKATFSAATSRNDILRAACRPWGRTASSPPHSRVRRKTTTCLAGSAAVRDLLRVGVFENTDELLVEIDRLVAVRHDAREHSAPSCVSGLRQASELERT